MITSLRSRNEVTQLLVTREWSTQTFTRFSDATGAELSVVQYFRSKYNISLKYPFLPAIQVGTDARPTYLPMEICRIKAGQRYTRKLNEKQVTSMLNATCKQPNLREADIRTMVTSNEYNQDELAKEFGIQVKPTMVSIEARVLPPPPLKYHESGRESLVNPIVGQWNMINKKMVNGGRVNFWACVNFSRSRDDMVNHFCYELGSMCTSKGMAFNPQPVIPIHSSHPGYIEKALHEIHSQVGQLDLLIVILLEQTGQYGTIKRVCETELGIVSQCCQPRHVPKCQKQYLENVAMKINVKGTSGVAIIAGLLGAVRAQGKPMIDFPKQKIVVAGAGRYWFGPSYSRTAI